MKQLLGMSEWTQEIHHTPLRPVCSHVNENDLHMRLHEKKKPPVIFIGFCIIPVLVHATLKKKKYTHIHTHTFVVLSLWGPSLDTMQQINSILHLTQSLTLTSVWKSKYFPFVFLNKSFVYNIVLVRASEMSPQCQHSQIFLPLWRHVVLTKI